jgi:hypothetical protein
MTAALRHVDHWLFAEYRASAHDLAVARIALASYLLLVHLPHGQWIADLPQAFYNPPLSVAMLTDDFASEAVVAVLNVAAFAATLSLLLGYRTRVASVATTLALIGLNSVVFATGKIDHNILLVVAAAIMAGSGWGYAWSVDAALGRVRHLEPDRPQLRWQLAWLALIIAIAIATAGLMKADTGWLHLTVSSSYGHALANAMLNARQTWLGGLLLRVPSSPIWEFTDWATIAIEVAGLFAVWRARWFRVWYAMLAAFHLAVALQMDILFASNLAAYAVFVPWAAVVAPMRRRLRAIARMRRAMVGGVVLMLTVRAAIAWTADTSPLVSWLSQSIKWTIVLGAVPLALWAWIASRRERHTNATDPGESPDGSDSGASVSTGAVTRRSVHTR